MRIQEYTEESKQFTDVYDYPELGNGWHMRTTTPAIDTRPIFLAHSSIIRPFLSLSYALSEKNRPGDKANTVQTWSV